MIYYWYSCKNIKDRVYIPKYYDPFIENDLIMLEETHNLFNIKDLVDNKILSFTTGDEIGKLAYGTGDIPFVRTSDISNWEIKSLPKQGISEEIYNQYVFKQDVKTGDILFVRDGTYLIGTNCIITDLDNKILYQSHILKIRVNDKDSIDPYLLFLSLNSDIVQKQIRNVQFTADTIDTIGNRFLELVLPIPKNKMLAQNISSETQKLLNDREKGRLFIIQAPSIMEEVLLNNTLKPIQAFASKDWDTLLKETNQQTITSEFGYFETFWKGFSEIQHRIYLPKYYDPDIFYEIQSLSKFCDCLTVKELIDNKIIECKTGDEIGKMSYGTGNIPFIRTSDFSNWEIKHDPKQGISEQIYLQYADSQDVQMEDIFLVRDGTYLIGTSCILLENDIKILYCAGIYKIRVLDNSILNSWLLIGLLNSYIVKRQLRTKQFTRDVIDTIGNRFLEVVLPIPKDSAIRQELSSLIQQIVVSRINARSKIKNLVAQMIPS